MTFWNRFSNPSIERNDEYYIRLGKQKDAHTKINVAVKSGAIIRPTKCSICGSSKKISGHHYKGYDFPYEVWWICHGCNMLLPFHDGVLSFEQAERYVSNRMLYKMAEKSIGRGMSVNALLLIGLNYIDYEMAWLVNKSDSEKAVEMLKTFDSRKNTTVTIVGVEIGHSTINILWIKQCDRSEEEQQTKSLLREFSDNRMLVIYIYYDSETPVVKTNLGDSIDMIDLVDKYSLSDY